MKITVFQRLLWEQSSEKDKKKYEYLNTDTF